MPKKQVPDFVVFIVTLLLLTIGIIMVFSASYVAAETRYGDGFYFFKRQLVWALIGIAGMTAVMKIDYSCFKKWALPIFSISVFLLVLVLIPGVGINIKGSTRWLGIGTLSFQPSEVAKLGLILILAKVLANQQNRIKHFLRGFIPPLLVVGLVCALILAQPDLGTAVTIAGTSYIMFIAAGARKSHLFGLAFLGLFLVAGAVYLAPYRMARFTAFLDPWDDPLGKGFQTIQSLLAVGSGRLFGMGLGQGRQKFLYLPEQHTDFIFAVLSEELGFIGSVFVLFLFFVFMWRGLRIALKAPDIFGALLAVGITGMVVIQAIINIGVVTGSLPVTGITLPFISYGGSSLTLNLLSIGILLNISRHVKE